MPIHYSMGITVTQKQADRINEMVEKINEVRRVEGKSFINHPEEVLPLALAKLEEHLNMRTTNQRSVFES